MESKRAWARLADQSVAQESKYNDNVYNHVLEIGAQIIAYLTIIDKDYRSNGKTILCAIKNTSQQYCRLFEEKAAAIGVDSPHLSIETSLALKETGLDIKAILSTFISAFNQRVMAWKPAFQNPGTENSDAANRKIIEEFKNHIFNYYCSVLRGSHNWNEFCNKFEVDEKELAEKIASAMIFEIITLNNKYIATSTSIEDQQLFRKYDLFNKLNTSLPQHGADKTIENLFEQRDIKIPQAFSRLVSGVVREEIKINDLQKEIGNTVYAYANNYGLMAGSEEQMLAALSGQLKMADENTKLSDKVIKEVKREIGLAILDYIQSNHKGMLLESNINIPIYLQKSMGDAITAVPKSDLKAFTTIIDAYEAKKNVTFTSNPMFGKGLHQKALAVKDKSPTTESNIEDKSSKGSPQNS